MREGAVEARAARAPAEPATAPPAARGPALPPGSQQALPYSYGGSGEMYFSKETLDQIMAGMRLKKSGNTRLIEGGRYNVNLRWNGTPSVELHGQTIDTWYMLAGGATVNTGYEVKDGQRVPNTGVSVVTKPGDVFFHPSAFYHGFSTVDPDIFWLNIRWDDNYPLPRSKCRGRLQAAQGRLKPAPTIRRTKKRRTGEPVRRSLFGAIILFAGGALSHLFQGRRRQAKNLGRIDLEQQIELAFGEAVGAKLLCGQRESIRRIHRAGLARVAVDERVLDTRRPNRVDVPLHVFRPGSGLTELPGEFLPDVPRSQLRSLLDLFHRVALQARVRVDDGAAHQPSAPL